MTFKELIENWDDLRVEAKRKKLIAVLEELATFVEDAEEEEVDRIVDDLRESLTFMEENDFFGTEGMTL